ncbi:hypothetical protein PtA15_8A156 [Puccinia triticina]|uniref:Uncharacterized protein n=1 Tax=Puccinia triticina TaxID=208348 RepID=A0ABY7CX02_9BASI|nr:uncharacterized protein PtA15_8A156 [Puccinia triticina]WAQ87252.1 hypothetical protein PtA15_8A156 [Puccinia triticina]
MANPTSYPSLPSPFQPAFSPPLPLSRPASRQSTRIITPAKTHANFVRPDPDNRCSLAARNQSDASRRRQTSQSQTQSSSKKSKKKTSSKSNSTNKKLKTKHTSTKKSASKKRKAVESEEIESKNTSATPLEDESASKHDDIIDGIDLVRDSGEENENFSKKKNTQKRPAKQFNDIESYFETPVHGEGEVSSSCFLSVTVFDSGHMEFY